MALPSPLSARPDPRDAFLDEAAHQLRTPLSPLLMLAHLVGEDPTLPEGLRPHLELMRENVERAARLIDELADYGRLRAGRLRIDADVLDFAALVAEAVTARAAEAAERGLSFETTCAEELPRLRGDGPRLRRVVDTLLCNAIVHADSRTPIVVRARMVGGSIALTVADQGRGIAPEALATLFDPEPASGSRRGSHLGVGLALARAIAELHRGSLVAHSDGPGRGATFTLRLPVA
jgi:signal transduction histidine kinase